MSRQTNDPGSQRFTHDIPNYNFVNPPIGYRVESQSGQSYQYTQAAPNRLFFRQPSQERFGVYRSVPIMPDRCDDQAQSTLYIQSMSKLSDDAQPQSSQTQVFKSQHPTLSLSPNSHSPYDQQQTLPHVRLSSSLSPRPMSGPRYQPYYFPRSSDFHPESSGSSSRLRTSAPPPRHYPSAHSAHPGQPAEAERVVVPSLSVTSNMTDLQPPKTANTDQTFSWMWKSGTADWTLYRVDKAGTLISKDRPPPQGTNKVSEGIGKTDYSDPRDFCAPTKEEQKDVWNALRPTRDDFNDLTHVNLGMNEMRCLDRGYNASWHEIKGKFVAWIFDHFSPDLIDTGRDTTSFRQQSSEVPGYATEGTMSRDKKPNDPKQTQYFVNGELKADFETLLCKLKRWYGLIEDYEYSPTWPYERRRDAQGNIIQNRDCCACAHCRGNQILCYGFREDKDRRCTPCAKLHLPCSNEDPKLENKQVWMIDSPRGLS